MRLTPLARATHVRRWCRRLARWVGRADVAAAAVLVGLLTIAIVLFASATASAAPGGDQVMAAAGRRCWAISGTG